MLFFLLEFVVNIAVASDDDVGCRGKIKD